MLSQRSSGTLHKGVNFKAFFCPVTLKFKVLLYKKMSYPALVNPRTFTICKNHAIFKTTPQQNIGISYP